MCAVLRLALARSDSLGRRRRAMATRRDLLVVPLNPKRNCRIGNTSKQQLCRVTRAVWRGKRQVRNRGGTVGNDVEGSTQGGLVHRWPELRIFRGATLVEAVRLPAGLLFNSSPFVSLSSPSLSPSALLPPSTILILYHLHLFACVSTLSVRHTPRHTVLNTNS